MFSYLCVTAFPIASYFTVSIQSTSFITYCVRVLKSNIFQLYSSICKVVLLSSGCTLNSQNPFCFVWWKAIVEMFRTARQIICIRSGNSSPWGVYQLLLCTLKVRILLNYFCSIFWTTTMTSLFLFSWDCKPIPCVCSVAVVIGSECGGAPCPNLSVL